MWKGLWPLVSWPGEEALRRTKVIIAAVMVLILVVAGTSYWRSLRRVPEPPAAEEEIFAQRRRELVDKFIAGQTTGDQRVIAAMLEVPRHQFVRKEYVESAYQDRIFPIGEGQTISQPSLVAGMTDLADVQARERVLEIGTGSGFQAAVLAELTDQVYTIEIIESLAAQAAQRLKRLGYTQIRTKVGDGYYGWEEHAPYDAIVVTCAPDHIPQPLVAQLKPGGKMVIPVGPPGMYQSLWLLEKKPDGTVQTKNMGGVIFVPMTGAARGWQP